MIGAVQLEDSVSGARFSAASRVLLQTSVAPGTAAGFSVVLAPTAPATMSRVLYGAFTWVASATVGNRLPVLRITDAADNILFQADAGVAITAGLTVVTTFGPGNIRGGALASGLYVPIPAGLVIPTGGKIKLLDSANIDATGDRLTWAIQLADTNMLLP